MLVVIVGIVAQYSYPAQETRSPWDGPTIAEVGSQRGSIEFAL